MLSFPHTNPAPKGLFFHPGIVSFYLRVGGGIFSKGADLGASLSETPGGVVGFFWVARRKKTFFLFGVCVVPLQTKRLCFFLFGPPGKKTHTHTQ